MRPETVDKEIEKSNEGVDVWLTNTGVIEIGSSRYYQLRVLISNAVKRGFDINSKPYAKPVRK